MTNYTTHINMCGGKIDLKNGKTVAIGYKQWQDRSHFAEARTEANSDLDN